MEHEGSKYSTVAITFHWLIAVAILANVALGWQMVRLQGLAQFTLFQLHKSVGISILLLGIFRLIWRFLRRPPAYPGGMRKWEQTAATALHWSLYTLTIMLPLTGWIIVSASSL